MSGKCGVKRGIVPGHLAALAGQPRRLSKVSFLREHQRLNVKRTLESEVPAASGPRPWQPVPCRRSAFHRPELNGAKGGATDRARLSTTRRNSAVQFWRTSGRLRGNRAWVALGLLRMASMLPAKTAGRWNPREEIILPIPQGRLWMFTLGQRSVAFLKRGRPNWTRSGGLSKKTKNGIRIS